MGGGRVALIKITMVTPNSFINNPVEIFSKTCW